MKKGKLTPRLQLPKHFVPSKNIGLTMPCKLEAGPSSNLVTKINIILLIASSL